MKYLFFFLLALMTLLPVQGCAPSRDAIPDVLAAYSEDLSGGTLSHPAAYSPEMRALLQERRHFYEEFFFNALHSDLTSISSRYEIRSIEKDASRKNTYIVKAVETIHAAAKFRLDPGGDPIARAAAWAIERTDNTAVKAELQILASTRNTAATRNSTEGYETDFVLEHTFLILRKWNGLQILEDACTDANPQDNPEGTDVIEWKNGTFERKQPDYSTYPDYSMYHTSIEELGQGLLEDYTK